MNNELEFDQASLACRSLEVRMSLLTASALMAAKTVSAHAGMSLLSLNGGDCLDMPGVMERLRFRSLRELTSAFDVLNTIMADLRNPDYWKDHE